MQLANFVCLLFTVITLIGFGVWGKSEYDPDKLNQAMFQFWGYLILIAIGLVGTFYGT